MSEQQNKGVFGSTLFWILVLFLIGGALINSSSESASESGQIEVQYGSVLSPDEQRRVFADEELECAWEHVCDDNSWLADQLIKRLRRRNPPPLEKEYECFVQSKDFAYECAEVEIFFESCMKDFFNRDPNCRKLICPALTGQNK